MFLLLMNKKQ